MRRKVQSFQPRTSSGRRERGALSARRVPPVLYDLMTFVVGTTGLFVAYWMHLKALSTASPISKVLFYAAAAVLVWEIVIPATKTASRRMGLPISGIDVMAIAP